MEQLVSTIAAIAALGRAIEQLVSAAAAIAAGFFNNYGAAATFAALVTTEFNNISTATEGNQQNYTVHCTYSKENQGPSNPYTDSEQTHSGPAKRLNSRSSPFHQVTKQPTRVKYPTAGFQRRFAG